MNNTPNTTELSPSVFLTDLSKENGRESERYEAGDRWRHVLRVEDGLGNWQEYENGKLMRSGGPKA